MPSSFPSPITAMKLLVSTGSDTYEQPITPSDLSGTTNNSIQIMPNTAVFNAFNNNPAGTIFTPSIVTSYGSDELGNALSIVSKPSVSNFVPIQITPNLSLVNIPNKLTTDSSFSLSVTTNSTGVLSYSSSAPSVATVNTTTGLVTIVGAGTTTITVNLAASANGVYTAATASRQLVVSVPLPLTLAYFNFDSNGNDASTNNNHLINYNSVTFNTVDFKRGTGAASFNGSNYFEIANDGRFSPDNFTIAFWVKPKSTSVTHQSIASCRNMTNNVNTGWMIYIVYGNNLNFVFGNGSNSFNGLFCDIGTFINNWVHVAITLNKSSSRALLYINGTLFSTNTLSYANNTGTNMRIGAGGNESPAGLFLVNGTLLDDFQFYNSVLSASEISSIYAE